MLHLICMPLPLPLQLKKLARLPLPAGALTLYLNTDSQSPAGRRWPQTLRQLWKRSQRLLPRPRAESIALIRAFAGETSSLLTLMLRRDENVRGVAIFAPLHRNTPIILSFPFPLPNQACYAPHLQLLPLLHAQAALVHCLVLALDYEHARWGEWWCNHLRWLGEEKMKIPRHHRTGGWSAERFARHRVMGHLRPFLRKVGVRTTRLVKTGEPWLLVGNKKVHSLFAALLPRQVKKLLLGRLSLDLDSPLPETRRKISAFLAAKQKAENQCLVKLLVRQEHKLSVLGTSAVLRALQEHRLPLLVLTFGVTMRGYFCANCGWLDTSQPRCAVCAQPMIATDDLIEHIAAYALAHDVQIRWVPPHAAFLARGGIGGFLRPLPSTLL